MSNWDTTSTFWNRAVIYLDDIDDENNTSESRTGLAMRPEPVDVSILQKVSDGTITDEDSKIDIFGSIAKYNSRFPNNPILADLRDRSEAEWKKLQQKGVAGSADDPAAVSDFNLKGSRLQNLDDCISAAAELLHQQDLDHPSNRKHESDLWDDETLIQQVREDWIKYYNTEKKKPPFSSYHADLNTRHAKAKLGNNKEELAQLYTEQLNFRKRIFKAFQTKLEKQMSRGMIESVKTSINDLEDSCTLFRALNVEESKRDRTILELVKEHDRAQAELAEGLDTQLSRLDANLEAVDLLLKCVRQKSRSASTRMRRLTAVDVQDEEERVREAERRAVGGGHAYFKAFSELKDTREFNETAELILDKIAEGIRTLPVEVMLDADTSAEMALLRVMDDLGRVVMEGKALSDSS
jgi:hypothetical protein